MPFDGFVTVAVVQELKEKIKGAKINNIYQHNHHEISISLRSFKKSQTLFISTHPTFCRVNLTSRKLKTPQHPPSFCMLLRKYLKGGIIDSIEQYQGDRILDFTITQKDEFGIIKETILTIEIMGKHSNVILVDKNNKRILDGLRKVKREFSNKREILPGVLFERPPGQNKYNPWQVNLNKENSLNLLEPGLDLMKENSTADNLLFNCFQGVSPLLSKELAFRAEINELELKRLNKKPLENLIKQLSTLKKNILSKNIEPTILKDKTKDKIIDFYLFSLTHSKNIISFKSDNSLMNIIDEFYEAKELEDKWISLKSKLKGKVNNLLKKYNKKLKKQRKEYNESENAQKYKISGELLTANLYRFTSKKPIEDKIEVLNYYKEPPEYIEIQLDQSLTPSENAQMYFKKYQKAKKRNKKLNKEIANTKNNIKYLDTINFHLENSQTLEELEAIQEELITGGYISKEKTKSDKKKFSGESKPLKYISEDGFEIWVGKNNKQNDYLTLRVASSEDIWLHTKEIAGSHVLIKGKNIPFSTILEAASIAAYYSRGRYSSNVPVDYTSIKHVRKPKGAKPGMVIYDNQKTLFVEPGKPSD